MPAGWLFNRRQAGHGSWVPSPESPPEFNIQSQPGKGTAVMARFRPGKISPVSEEQMKSARFVSRCRASNVAVMEGPGVLRGRYLIVLVDGLGHGPGAATGPLPAYASTPSRKPGGNRSRRHEARKIVEFSYPWTATALLIMHSDGLMTRRDLQAYPGLIQRHQASSPACSIAILSAAGRRHGCGGERCCVSDD